MRSIIALLTVFLLAGGCASNDVSQAQKDDPAGAITGNGMIGTPPILVPGARATVY